jgi:two-component system response regulator NreC
MSFGLDAGRQGRLELSQVPDARIRLALLDDQTLFREGLRALIDAEPDFQVVAQAGTLQAMSDLAIEPRVIVADLDLPDVRHNVVIERLRDRFHDAALIALTALDDLPTVQRALAAGADGYVLKSAAKSDLFSGIRTVARGGLYLQPSIGIAFASRPPEDAAHPAVGGLTPKETDVLRLLALGHTNAEIAQLLGTSLRTIETHRAHIHQKLDRHSRAELVRFALDAGLLRLDDNGAPAPDLRVVSRQGDPVPG